MSIRILQIIAQKHSLKIMVGDIRNTFSHAPTNKKFYTVAGEEFRERQRCITEIISSQYWMATASRFWSPYLRDFIQSIEYIPVRADPDIQMKKDPNYDKYCYISIHINDFFIVEIDSESVMNAFKEKFNKRNNK